MIRTMLRVGFISMRRDRVVLAMTFLLPVLFFSIFALVFGQQRDPTSKINVALVDEDQSPYSRALAKAFMAEGALAIRTTPDRAGKEATLDRAAAEKLVKDGTVPVAVVLTKGIGDAQIFGGPPDPSQVQAKVLVWPMCRIRSRRRLCRACCRRSASLPRRSGWRTRGWRHSRNTAAR